MWRAFYVGFKLDLRMAVAAVIPVLVLSLIPKLNPARSAKARHFWSVHFAILTAVLVAVLYADLGHYDYLQTRLEISALRFLSNPLISMQMVWETYSVIPATLLLAVIAFGTYWFLQFFQNDVRFSSNRPSRAARITITTAMTVFMISGLYGKFSYYPLRWSDTYFSAQQFPADLATNPVLRTINTIATGEQFTADPDSVRENYDSLAAYLGVDTPNADTLNLDRNTLPTPVTDIRPNVVVIMMGSFASHLTGFHGNPLDASPAFDRYAESGLAFTNHYTPGFGTAHGIYTMFTGIPDVSLNRTASRNPKAIHQNMILNELEGYEKYYFLGGSANWANIRALLTLNIDDLKLYEEGDYPNSPRTDVWGISDLHLFEESNRVLAKADAPFFAFINLSGNHRPYTIPPDNRGFVPEDIDDELALANGFDKVDGYNSFRFLDHSLEFFIELAVNEEYFENTLFVLTADNGEHGPVNGSLHFEEESRVSNHHAPFVIFGAPLTRQAERIQAIGTQMDIMPTIAGAIGIPAKNTTLGRNLLDPAHSNGFAFIHRRRGSGSEILSYDGRHLLTQREQNVAPLLQDLKATDNTQEIIAENPELVKKMAVFSDSFYAASRYLLFRDK